jgi:uncharacterized Zn-binding protein involved in type VI secretion
MGAHALHAGDQVTCSHNAPATPGAPVPRVKIGGQPVVAVGSPYTIAGCPLQVPCATGQWTAGATRVRVAGQPLAIETGASVCVPTGAPLAVKAVQSHVTAS